jgi:hypothetical protein
MDHWAAIAKTGDALAVEQMGINASGLRRGVNPQTQGSARELVDHFEGLQILSVVTGRQQRLGVFDQWRHDQFITEATRGVQTQAPQFFNVPSL